MRISDRKKDGRKGMITKGNFEIELSVNGKDVEMNEFVHNIIGNLILGILRSIRLDEEPKTATLSIKLDK
jgi:hypothetical protein